MQFEGTAQQATGVPAQPAQNADLFFFFLRYIKNDKNDKGRTPRSPPSHSRKGICQNNPTPPSTPNLSAISQWTVAIQMLRRKITDTIHNISCPNHTTGHTTALPSHFLHN